VSLAAVWLQLRSLLECRNRVGCPVFAKQRLAKGQVSACERRGELDDLAQLLDLSRRSGLRAGAIRDREVELRVHRRGRQRHGLLQLADGRFSVGGSQGSAEVGASLRVVGADAHRLTKRSDSGFVLASLNQDQTEMVVGFSEIRPHSNGFAERGRHFVTRSASAAEHAAKNVVCRRRGACRAGASGGGWVAGLDPRPKRRNGGIPVRRGKRRRGHVQAGLELSQRFAELAGAKIGDTEIDVNSGRGR
jgi:hypothetical protein